MGYFKCGQLGYFLRECPKNKQGAINRGNITQCSLVSPPDRVALREATSSAGGGTNRLYGLNNCQEYVNSLDVLTCMIQVHDFIVYALPDPGPILYFLTPYVAMNFDIFSSNLVNH